MVVSVYKANHFHKVYFCYIMICLILKIKINMKWLSNYDAEKLGLPILNFNAEKMSAAAEKFLPLNLEQIHHPYCNKLEIALNRHYENGNEGDLTCSTLKDMRTAEVSWIEGRLDVNNQFRQNLLQIIDPMLISHTGISPTDNLLHAYSFVSNGVVKLEEDNWVPVFTPLKTYRQDSFVSNEGVFFRTRALNYLTDSLIARMSRMLS